MVGRAQRWPRYEQIFQNTSMYWSRVTPWLAASRSRGVRTLFSAYAGRNRPAIPARSGGTPPEVASISLRSIWLTEL